MELNEYEQLLIKSEYISTVCDQLLKQLETSVLSKSYLRLKLGSDSEYASISHKYNQLKQFEKDISSRGKQKAESKTKQLDIQIKESQSRYNALKRQISELKQSKFETSKNSRQTTRIIKKISQAQLESMQLRRLLNFELQNLNKLETSKIQLKESLENYDKKQIKLKNQIDLIVDKQRAYYKCRQLEQRYEALLDEKRKLAAESILFDQKKNSDIFNKISAITQANQNLNEMERYEKQLNLMIKQQNFIINQIQQRQINSDQEDLQIVKKIDDDQRTSLFQKQIQNLRKTIANRKFMQKDKNSKATKNKLQAFLNNPTPKNMIYPSIQKPKSKQKSQSKQQSIFKISIQPVSHTETQKQSIEHEDKSKMLPKHRNSLPTKLNKKISPQMTQFKQISMKKPYLSENQIPNFNEFEINALEKILKKKQEQMKYVIQNKKEDDPISLTPIVHRKNNFAKNSGNSKFIQKEGFESNQTTPINPNELHIGPNSRFIEQIIEQNNSQHLSKLKYNVRIRTKKSETQKCKHLTENPLRGNMKKIPKKSSRSTHTSPQKQQKHSNTHMSTEPKDIKKSETTNRTSFSTQENQNQFLSQNMVQKVQDLNPSKRMKYKDKLQVSPLNKNIEEVFKKIKWLTTNQQEESNQTNDKIKGKKEKQQHREQKRDKIKIFKMPNRKKYGNSLSFLRKGTAEALQQSESSNELDLPKIEQEQESLRNTIPQVKSNRSPS